MKENEKSMELQKEWNEMSDYERRASNAYEQNKEITNSTNRRLRKKGIRDLYFNLNEGKTK